MSELGFISISTSLNVKLRDCRITTFQKFVTFGKFAVAHARILRVWLANGILPLATTATRFRTVPQFATTIILALFLPFLWNGLGVGANTSSASVSNTIDSLRQVIKNAKHDTTRINAYFLWGDVYLYSVPDTAMIYYEKSKALAEKLLATHPPTNVADTAKKQLAYALNNIGYIYDDQGDIQKALEYYNKSLNIQEDIGDKQGMATSFNNIGSIYKNQGDIPKVHHVERDSLLNRALEYYNKSLNIQEEIGDKKGMAYSFNNIGNIYDNQASEVVAKRKSRQSASGGGSDSLIKKALEYYNKSLNILEEIGNKKGMALSLYNIGNVYLVDNNIQNAKAKFEQSYKLSKELGFPDDIEYAAGGLKKVYLKQGNYKLAYEFYQEEVLMHDSIQNEENFKKTMQQHARYEYEKAAAVAEIAHTKAMEIKDLQMAKIEEEKKKQRVVIYSFVAGFIIILIFSIVIFRLFMQKKKANLILARQKQQIEIQNSNLNQANEEITAQRDEISAQRDTVTRQKEHIEEIHKEVTDSINYAKRIQEAMLPDLESEKVRGGESEKVRGGESEKVSRRESENWHTVSQSHFRKVSLSQSPTVSLSQSLTFETFILFKPKDVVSGDFYWFSKVNDYQIYAVADCTGHGVPGAFMSMLGISFLNEIVRKKEVTQASHVLDQLRVSVIDALRQTGGSGTQKDGMDMSIVVIKNQVQSPKSQVSSSKLQESEKVREGESETASANNQSSIDNNQSCHAQWAGANNPLWLVRSRQSLIANNQSSIDNLIEFKPDKMPIAIYEKMNRFTNHEITLCSGDTIYLMSDGYEDQFGGPKGKKFLSKNLKELIIANCLLTMEEQKQILEKTLIDWIGEGEQIDDITILGIKI